MKKICSSCVIIFFIILLLGINSCKDDLPVVPPDIPPDYRKINLTIEDVSCTTVWLKISLDSIDLPSELRLELNNNEMIINISQRDTVLAVDSLLPNQNYHLKGVLLEDSTINSEQSFRTLNTTNPVYTWQRWEFGEHGHSILWDIKIINENNIWAAGAIYLKDSLGNNDHNAYNAIHWDGSKWEMFRIPFYTVCGSNPSNKTSYPIKTIKVFNENEIWFFMFGNEVVKFKNNILSEPFCIQDAYSIHAVWGNSPNNIYAAGEVGYIAHYNGTSWTKIESGTTTNLQDVYGSPGGEVIYVCGSLNSGEESAFLKIENNKVKEIFKGPAWSEINGKHVGLLNSVWTKNKFQTYYLNPSGSQINVQAANQDSLNPHNIVYKLGDFMFKLRGTDHNNLFVAGQGGIIGHYNGMSYKIIYNSGIYNLTLFNIDIKDNILASSGSNYSSIYSKATIVLGRTN
jgi:hypothetical protein